MQVTSARVQFVACRMNSTCTDDQRHLDLGKEQVSPSFVFIHCFILLHCLAEVNMASGMTLHARSAAAMCLHLTHPQG